MAPGDSGPAVLFFFSSRRRHTRCSRDWSSDVCSSDLLRIDIVELFCGDEFLGERATRAFGKDGDFSAKFISGSKVVFGIAVLVDALVFGDDAGDSVAFVNEFGAAKFLEDIDAGGFHKPAEPFADFVQRNNVVALVLKRRRSRSEEHTSELQSRLHLVCRLLLEKKKPIDF